MSRTRSARMQPAVMRSRSGRAAQKREAMVAVCLIGWSEPGPRFFGDNRGGLPVRVVVTKREKTAAKDDDLAQPYNHFTVLEWVHVDSKEHGDRLKAALDVMLIGEQSQQNNEQPRHKFRDVYGCFSDEWTRQMWWGILLEGAMTEVKRQSRSFKTYDDNGKVEKIAASARSFARGR